MNGEIEFRASEVADVSFPKRQIELIVMPYETEASVAYRGRMITEICSRGAYDGVDLRTSRIRVNRDHVIGDVVGKTVALHPSRSEGLVAELRIFTTPRGEETLVLADEGGLDASAGFALLRANGRTGPVVPNAEVWEKRDRRRLNRLFLDHIAMTPEPAYPDSRVLAVRSGHDSPPPAETATPNLDRMQLAELCALRDVIDAKYGLTR